SLELGIDNPCSSIARMRRHWIGLQLAVEWIGVRLRQAVLRAGSRSSFMLLVIVALLLEGLWLIAPGISRQPTPVLTHNTVRQEALPAPATSTALPYSTPTTITVVR